MSFMPDVGSRVKLANGQVGIVTKVTPDGRHDEVQVDGEVVRVTAWDIAEVLDDD